MKWEIPYDKIKYEDDDEFSYELFLIKIIEMFVRNFLFRKCLHEIQCQLL